MADNGSQRSDAQDVPEIFDTTIYTLARGGLTVTRDKALSQWTRYQ